ncbi:hypothetical protein MHH60_20160 [Paenibacillus sp. FSL H7-0716]|uniref:Uncharacterized protein n=1 Tax=Paenibacillus odorifer TaxID=189426 RepID=A0AB36JB73_9BACL|nr:hypothetical protein [Paenibacillus odorifer]OME16528.1 hypothetical protein BSK47_19895 [Paenibacillus odorifer]
MAHEKIQVDFKQILEELSKPRKFSMLEKITEVFLLDKNVPNYMDFIMRLFGPEVGQGLFVYISSEKNVDSVPDKNLREALAKINTYKNFYGDSLRQTYAKMGRPFMIGAFHFTRELSEQVAVVTLRRNDNVEFSGQLDFNTSVMLTQQLVDLMGQMYKSQKEQIELDNIIKLMNELAQFVETVLENQQDVSEE